MITQGTNEYDFQKQFFYLDKVVAKSGARISAENKSNGSLGEMIRTKIVL